MSKTIEGDNGKPMASGGSGVNIPKSVWTTVRDNSKATPDAYAEEGNPQFISEFGSASSEGLAKLGNLFKGGKSAIGNIKDAMSFMNNVSKSVSNITKGGSISDIISNFSKSASANLSMLGIDKNNPILRKVDEARNLVTKVNDTYQRIRNIDFHSVDGLMHLAKDLTGNPDFLQISQVKYQADYISGLTKEMISQGIPNSFSAFKDILKNNPHKHEVVKDTYPTAVSKQDLGSINAMVDLLGQRRFTRTISQTNLSGNFTNVITKNWDKNNERLDVNKENKFREIKETLKNVNGDNWLYHKRNNQDTINIKDYLYASNRFKDLFNQGIVNSNQVRPLTRDDINEDIKQEIKSNDKTTLDDEKFLVCLFLNTYNTPKQAIQRDFPRVYLDSTNISI